MIMIMIICTIYNLIHIHHIHPYSIFKAFSLSIHSVEFRMIHPKTKSKRFDCSDTHYTHDTQAFCICSNVLFIKSTDIMWDCEKLHDHELYQEHVVQNEKEIEIELKY